MNRIQHASTDRETYTRVSVSRGRSCCPAHPFLVLTPPSHTHTHTRRKRRAAAALAPTKSGVCRQNRHPQACPWPMAHGLICRVGVRGHHRWWRPGPVRGMDDTPGIRSETQDTSAVRGRASSVCADGHAGGHVGSLRGSAGGHAGARRYPPHRFRPTCHPDIGAG